MRQNADFFGDVDLPLIFIAKKLKEALAVEDLLSRSGLDYLVEPDTYRGGIIFVSERVGAFFYVAPDRAEEAPGVMSAAGYRTYKPD